MQITLRTKASICYATYDSQTHQDLSVSVRSSERLKLTLPKRLTSSKFSQHLLRTRYKARVCGYRSVNKIETALKAVPRKGKTHLVGKIRRSLKT